jgi:cellulose synthase/poly-beta-1,6-N-acetylglucosamine synthase-like glycosyltransferase
LYNFLGELAATNQDVPSHLLFLDHDMMTRPDIINDALLSLENDPSLAFVQYPLRFHDLRGCDLFHAGNEVFFDGVQINRGRVGLAAFAGTNAVWNIQALFHVGGLGYNTLTEDTATGYDIHRVDI